MPLPRAPKVERVLLDPADAPQDRYPTIPIDAYGRGPAEPWLKTEFRDGQTVLLRRAGDAWAEVGPGYSIQGYLTPDRALVPFEKTELRIMDPQGATRTIWTGPEMQQIDQAIWGGNWMFGATTLPDGRFLASVPDPAEAEKPLGARLQRLVLFAADGTPLDGLPLFERAASAVKRGFTTRFISRMMAPGLGGKVVAVPSAPALMVAGVFGDRLRWIGKGAFTDGGGLYSDGTDLVVSSGLYNSKVRFWRLDNLAALYAKAEAKL